MKINEELNERLKTVRKALNMNQKEMAEKLGVKPSYYSDLENGKRNVTSRIIEGLKNNFDISADWMYTGKGNIKLTFSGLKSTPENVHLMSTSDSDEVDLIPSSELKRIANAWQRSPEEQIIWEKEIDKRYEKARKYNDLFSNELGDENPELLRLFYSLKNIVSLSETIESVDSSLIGETIREYWNIYKEKYSDGHGHRGSVEYLPYPEYKTRLLNAISKLSPYRLIFNEFSEAATKFTSQIHTIAKEINYEDDFIANLENTEQNFIKSN